MTSGTVSSFVLLLLSSAAFAQQQVQFNQVLNVNGDVSKPNPTPSKHKLMMADGAELLCVPRPLQGRDLLSEAATNNR